MNVLNWQEQAGASSLRRIWVNMGGGVVAHCLAKTCISDVAITKKLSRKYHAKIKTLDNWLGIYRLE